ncbi:HAD family hydrolase [Myxosarcina sp. GI1]|uniref:HAD family hydrolase n=1 Tax=Myxosarcina sp. GI1 TaxID=1541065 RepID=UPI00056D2060|nr:HAD family hydrolase [Myxosarcina sp. GI1]
MSTKPILKAITDKKLGNIRLLATDLDGTLTHNGKLTSDVLLALEKLAKANISVVIVTGRSAGWVEAIASYLPIVGAIAENGGLVLWSHLNRSQLITEIKDIAKHRQQLKTVFQLIQTKIPQIEESEDNRFRLTDWTFDINNLTNKEIEEIATICHAEGWGFTYSNVQCHIKPKQQDKAIALKLILQQYFPDLTTENIITVGDSPNDESLFDPQIFPVSVGVANILEYRDRLKHLPVYITTNAENRGFYELAELVINTNK